MSNKTIFKRIALVAASALTAGVVSAIPAQAADAVLTLAASDGSPVTLHTTSGTNRSVGILAGSGAVSSADTASMLNTGTAVFHVADGDGNNVVTVSGGTITAATDDTSNGPADTLNIAGTSAGDAADFAFAVTPNPGSTTITVRLFDAAAATTSSSGGTQVALMTITVGTSANVGVFAASESFASVVSTAASGAHATNSDTANANLVANGGEGIIALTARDGLGAQQPTSSIITATATNGAVVAFSSGAQLGASTSKAYGGTFENIYVAQGTANKGITTTVTVSVDGVTWTSKTFVLYGAVNTIAIGSPSVGQKSGTGAFYLEVRDDNNQLLASVTPSADSSLYNSSVTSVTPAVSSGSAASAQSFACSAIVGTGKIQYYHTNAAAKKILSNVLDVSCAGDPYTWTASLDKASYAPGDIATLTISAKDSKGFATNETVTLGTATSAELVVSGAEMTAVSTPTNADKFSSAAGARTYKFTVGKEEGAYNMVIQMPKWSGGANSSAVTQGAVTVPYKVAGTTATVTNADVLKSIVSLIASINKQIQALQKLILRR
jgi:hypothetical protein